MEGNLGSGNRERGRRRVDTLCSRRPVCLHFSYLARAPKGNFTQEGLENQTGDRPASAPNHAASPQGLLKSRAEATRAGLGGLRHLDSRHLNLMRRWPLPRSPTTETNSVSSASTPAPGGRPVTACCLHRHRVLFLEETGTLSRGLFSYPHTFAKSTIPQMTERLYPQQTLHAARLRTGEFTADYGRESGPVHDTHRSARVSVTEATGRIVERPCPRLSYGPRCPATPCRASVGCESVTKMGCKVPLGCVPRKSFLTPASRSTHT